jgi:hypothetical protein
VSEQGVEQRRAIRRALVSVYDKTGLEELAQGLHDAGVTLVSTGSTAARIAAAGVPVTPGFMNSGPVVHPHLLAFGDVIGVPAPFGLGNVLSVGDLLILAGLLVILHSACGAPREAEPDMATDTRRPRRAHDHLGRTSSHPESSA